MALSQMTQWTTMQRFDLSSSAKTGRRSGTWFDTGKEGAENDHKHPWPESKHVHLDPDI
jgi:hypothetical protein